MKDKKKVPLIVLIIVLLVIAFGVGAFIVIQQININTQNKDYNNLSSSYAPNIESDITSPSINADDETVENPIDFSALAQQNEEIYSWIYIPDTNVNYPVCQSVLDDNFYLDHDVHKNYSFPGAIYSQMCNKKDYSDRVTVLYGHNMANGSMFANLHKFANKDFFDEHDRMYVYTPYSKLTYEIVAAYIYDDRHIMNTFDFKKDEDFQQYIDSIISPRSVSQNVREGATLTNEDKILTLSTCLDVGEGRYLVQGKLIKKEKTE